ncbi:VVA0879 family protein [Devosia honganensis]|uniref:VVA0879 family protein n=1 Tax=Devosia honganensis TaxID=1610527 RepID=A0ABV7X6H3_9HYPH
MAETMTIPEFHAALKAQGVGHHMHCAFVCPICATVQSGADWMRATGKTFEEIEPKVGFSCIGRGTGAGEHRRGTPPGKGCNWTLGGFFRLHKLEVVDAEGKNHPMFEIATPEQAQAHKLASEQAAA